MNNFEIALKEVFFVEGGYSDHPEDKGGKTKYGITEGTLAAWLTEYPEVRRMGIQDVTPHIAGVIYRDLYWDKVRGDELPRGVSLMVFDSAVHAGPSRAIRWLQGAGGERVDGIIGPKTLQAANRTNRSSSTHYPLLAVKEMAMYRLMLARNNETFVKGWFNRIIHILAASVEEIWAPPYDAIAETCVTSDPGKTPPQ